jgi:hypothetical protein
VVGEELATDPVSAGVVLLAVGAVVLASGAVVLAGGAVVVAGVVVVAGRTVVLAVAEILPGAVTVAGGVAVVLAESVGVAELVVTSESSGSEPAQATNAVHAAMRLNDLAQDWAKDRMGICRELWGWIKPSTRVAKSTA